MSKCQETAGFLISAACSDSAEHKCRQCGKPVCGRHTRSDPNGGQVCIACYRKSGAAYGQSNDDPYLYSGAHHPEYYAYAVAGTAVGVAATAAAMDWAKERKAFRPQEEEDWTDEGWESDYDGS